MVPSGRVHEAINLTALGAASAVYFTQFSPATLPSPLLLAFSVSYLIGTFLVTPDLDLAEQNVRAKGRWGIMGGLWVPYGLLFSHRGLSHTWLIGPITRLVYMGIIGAALFFVGEALAGYLGISLQIQAPKVPPQDILWALGGGYYVSQWMHLIADGIAPDTKIRR
jgi:uncharacterized metal-binding protein